MPFVQRDQSGAITGLYARPQEGYAEEFLADNDAAVLAWLNPPPGPVAVDAERDRRILAFSYAGKAYQLDDNSQQNIIAATTRAILVLSAGGTLAAPGNLRWFDPSNDFGWIATDNSIVPMDATAMATFGGAVQTWVSRHIFAARAIKNLSPIPADFAADSRWPSS